MALFASKQLYWSKLPNFPWKANSRAQGVVVALCSAWYASVREPLSGFSTKFEIVTIDVFIDVFALLLSLNLINCPSYLLPTRVLYKRT
jgi:hypothetical protein